MAVCIAVIGKENSPLFIASVNPELELSFHYTVHTSLDIVEEKVNNIGKQPTDHRDLYLGALYSTEQEKVYGYVTNTKIKFVIVVDSSNTSLRDNEIRQMFRRIHTAYTNMLSNPFYIPGDKIESKKFDAVVKNIMGVPATQ